MKRNTQKRAKKLGIATVRLIRGNHGMLKAITVHGGFSDHTFPSHVVAGRKLPSLNFWRGLDGALAEMRLKVAGEIIRREHPEIEAVRR